MDGVVVLDFGADSLRAGLAAPPNSAPGPTVVLPNECARVKGQLEALVAEQCRDAVTDPSQLTFSSPMDRGFICDWDTQGAVLQHLFSRWLKADLQGASLACTLPAQAPSSISALAWEALFETHQIGQLATLAAPVAAAVHAFSLPSAQPSARQRGTQPASSAVSRALRPAHAEPADGFRELCTGLVVDAGHSATTLTPVIQGCPLRQAARRVNVGGKALRNALTQALSKRQVDLTSLPHVAAGVFKAAAFMHPFGGGAVLRSVAQAQTLAQDSCLPALHSAYVRHIAPARKGVCTPLEATLWGMAASREVALQLHVGKESGSSATRPAAAKRSRKGVSHNPLEHYPCSPLLDHMAPVDSWREHMGGVLRDAATRTALGAGAELTLLAAEAAQDSLSASLAWDGVGLGIQREYVLPDAVAVQEGFLRGSRDDPFLTGRAAGLPCAGAGQATADGGSEVEDPVSDAGLSAVTVGAHRFSIPELLFTPSSAGVLQGGVTEAATASIGACPPEWQPALWGNVALVGGLAQLPGFRVRLARELRAAAPADMPVCVWRHPEPAHAAWLGMQHAMRLPSSQHEHAYAALALTAADYAEHGALRCVHSAQAAWSETAPALLGAHVNPAVDDASALAALAAAQGALE